MILRFLVVCLKQIFCVWMVTVSCIGFDRDGVLYQYDVKKGKRNSPQAKMSLRYIQGHISSLL